MNPLIKIPRPLLERALEDLERPHAFAAERLGFFSLRQSNSPTFPHLLCYDYHPIADECYMHDETVGGRINSAAIQDAMTRGYQQHAGQLWVHTHGRKGIPGTSGTDRANGPRVAQSCANLQPKLIHGWAVISEEGIAGEIRLIDGRFVALNRISVVGWPMVIPSRPKPIRPFRFLQNSDRYSRQGFLGPEAQDIIRNAKLGFVGLGGGGSHLVQQAAHVGFQHGVLCDAQRIEETNLNRLVGATVKDIPRRMRSGRYKTEIAARVWRGLQPGVNLHDSPMPWEEKRGELRECDVIFGAIDGFAARRDLEAFCRAEMIPLVDIGMVVLRPENRAPEIRGQVILSMPGELCMHCIQFLTEANISEDVQQYDKDPQPQVIWPNGVLASNAIGYALGLLTGWSGASRPSCRVDYRGSQMTMTPSNMVAALSGCNCKHYPLSQCGAPIFRPL